MWKPGFDEGLMLICGIRCQWTALPTLNLLHTAADPWNTFLLLKVLKMVIFSPQSNVALKTQIFCFRNQLDFVLRRDRFEQIPEIFPKGDAATPVHGSDFLSAKFCHKTRPVFRNTSPESNNRGFWDRIVMSSLSVIKSHLDNGHGKGEIQLYLSNKGWQDNFWEPAALEGKKNIILSWRHPTVLLNTHMTNIINVNNNSSLNKKITIKYQWTFPQSKCLHQTFPPSIYRYSHNIFPQSMNLPSIKKLVQNTRAACDNRPQVAPKALGSWRPHSNCMYRTKVYWFQLTYIDVTLSLPG